jgi:hypothetical protein
MRSVRVVAALEVVVACSCCDTASTAVACSREAAAVTWTMVMGAAKSDRATVSVSMVG